MKKILSASFINLGFSFIILVFAFGLTPYLLNGLGDEGFSTFMLLWGLVTSLAFIETTLYRSTVFYQTARHKKSNELLSASFAISLLFGSATFLFLYLILFISNFYDFKTLDFLKNYQALIFPLSSIVAISSFSSILRGFEESRHNFLQANIFKTLNSISNYIVPAVCLYFGSKGFNDIFHFILLLRFALLGIQVIILLKFSNLSLLNRFTLDDLNALKKFGGWLTASNISVPLSFYLSRIIIADVCGLELLPLFLIPFEVLSKTSLISESLSRVLFPYLTSINDTKNKLHILQRSTAILLLIGLAGTLGVFFVGDLFLEKWISLEFSMKAFENFKYMSLATFFILSSNISYNFLQSYGYTKITGLIHLAHVPINLLATYFLTSRMGVSGAAISFVFISVLESVSLYFLSLWMTRSNIQPRFISSND